MQSGTDYYNALIERGFPAETALQNAQQHFPGFQINQPQAVTATTSPVMASTLDAMPQQKSRDGGGHGFADPANQMTNVQQAAQPQQAIPEAQQPIAQPQQQVVGIQPGQLQMAAQPGQIVVQPGLVGQQQMVAGQQQMVGAPMAAAATLGGAPVHASAMQSPYGIPLSGTESGIPIPFSLGQSLFSFEGRMRRLHFGFVQLGFMFLWFGLAFVLIMGLLATEGAGSGFENGDPMMGAMGGIFGVICLIAIPALWVNFAVQVKRLHDLEHSGFLVLVPMFAGIIPFVGGFISIGFIFWLIFADGIAGHNKFGPDPKGRTGAPQVNPAGAFAQQPF